MPHLWKHTRKLKRKIEFMPTSLSGPFGNSTPDWNDIFSSYQLDEALETNVSSDFRLFEPHDFEGVNANSFVQGGLFHPSSEMIPNEERSAVLCSSEEFESSSSGNNHQASVKRIARRVPDLSERLKALVSEPNSFIQGNAQYFDNDTVANSMNRESSTQTFIPRLKRTTVLDSKKGIIWFNLQSLAQAFATFDQDNISHYISVLKVDSKPTGTVMERLSYYYVHSLIARHNGTGAEFCKTLASQNDNSIVMHSFMNRLFSETPVPYLTFLARLDGLLEICPDSAAVLHIVDFSGFLASWCPVIKQIRSSPNRILQLKITMVIFTDDNFEDCHSNPEAALPAVQFLAESMGLNPVIRIIQCTLKEFSLSAVKVPGETLVVNCGNVLGQFPDSSVLKSNPRGTFIQMMSEAEPDLVMLSEMNFDLNTQFFLKRFQTAMDLGFFILSMVERVCSNSDELLMVERNAFMRKAVNTVACEGLDRFMRTEEFQSWKQRFTKAGFAVKPMPPSLLLRLKKEGKRFGPETKVDVVDGAMHIFWNGSPISFHASWRMKQ